MERARLMGYALSFLMSALQTWLNTKLWDSFYKTVQWESVLGVLGNMDSRHYCVRKYSAE